MSTTLPEDAPVETPAVASVETPAPGDVGAVAEESVGSGEAPKTVPAERFNGLMSKFNQTQSENQMLTQRLSELEARLNQQSQTPEEPEPTVSDNSHLEARIEQLQEMLIQERRDAALTKALDDYPEAKPFADLIVADSPQDVREMARLIAERAKAANPTPTPSENPTEDPAPVAEAEAGVPVATEAETPEVPVAGGGAAFSTEASVDDRVADAIQRGSFADLLNAKWEQASLGLDTNVG